jgi:hypothetical protein
MRRQYRAQLDLFAKPSQPTELPANDRQKAVALLETLLREATTKFGPQLAAESGKEAGDEQDHA